MRKITMLSMLLVVALLSVPSCAPTVSQQEYDRVSNELSAIQSQLASLQGKLAEAELLQVQNEELNKQFDAAKSEFETMQVQNEELNKQFDAAKSEFETMQAKYEELSTEYKELSKQHDIITEKMAEINEEDVEQAVFKLVNQERRNNELNEVEWGANIYKWAIENSRNMATNKRLEYSEMIGWQEVFWATGYSTKDGIANAALTIWKNRTLYKRKFLNPGANYCAAAVHKSGEIFYITYVADYFK